MKVADELNAPKRVAFCIMRVSVPGVLPLPVLPAMKDEAESTTTQAIFQPKSQIGSAGRLTA
jgi:hypothetical protein